MIKRTFTLFPIILLISNSLSCAKGPETGGDNKSEKDTLSGYFTNPLQCNGNYSDPWVIRIGSKYYYSGSDGKIFINVSNNLKEIVNQTHNYIYTPTKGSNCSEELWAPELHFLRGHWYVYFAADDGKNDDHRMYVLEGGNDENDPLNGEYTLKGELISEPNNWAIDGTVFEFHDSLYFIWSGWPGNINLTQCLYIARMINPYTLEKERYLISCPENAWEINGSPTVNEGPEVLISNNTVNIIYSASGSWTDDYCLGRITCTNGNLLDKNAWTKVGPVFSKTEYVFGPGHASFVSLPNGLQWWIVYHAAKQRGSGWDRNVRIQPFTWNGDIPEFGKPLSPGVYIKNP